MGMNKKELFDALDEFSQNLLVTLAEVEAIKKNLKGVVEENVALRLENDKLRERLGQWSIQQHQKQKEIAIICASCMKMVFMSVRIFMVNAVKMMQNACFVTSCCLGSKHADSKKF